MKEALTIGALLGLAVAWQRAPGLLVVLVIGAVGVLLVRHGGGRPATGQRASAGAITGHAHHASDKLTATHEAGHVAVARALGGTGIHASVSGSSGWTSATHRKGIAGDVAFLRGGRYAARSGSGCSYDEAMVRKVLREVPPRERGRIEREGNRIARRAVSAHRAAIVRDAAILRQTGRL